jgi:ubiquitin carboxyl-terminal hydrolase L5
MGGQFENEMRRHNHVGLVHALLVKLAEKGQLDERIEAAKVAYERRAAREREREKGAS